MYNVLIYVDAYKILSDSFFYYLTFAGTKLNISDYYSYCRYPKIYIDLLFIHDSHANRLWENETLTTRLIHVHYVQNCHACSTGLWISVNNVFIIYKWWYIPPLLIIYRFRGLCIQILLCIEWNMLNPHMHDFFQ